MARALRLWLECRRIGRGCVCHSLVSCAPRPRLRPAARSAVTLLGPAGDVTFGFLLRAVGAGGFGASPHFNMRANGGVSPHHGNFRGASYRPSSGLQASGASKRGHSGGHSGTVGAPPPPPPVGGTPVSPLGLPIGGSGAFPPNPLSGPSGPEASRTHAGTPPADTSGLSNPFSWNAEGGHSAPLSQLQFADAAHKAVHDEVMKVSCPSLLLQRWPEASTRERVKLCRAPRGDMARQLRAGPLASFTRTCHHAPSFCTFISHSLSRPHTDLHKLESQPRAKRALAHLPAKRTHGLFFHTPYWAAISSPRHHPQPELHIMTHTMAQASSPAGFAGEGGTLLACGWLGSNASACVCLPVCHCTSRWGQCHCHCRCWESAVTPMGCQLCCAPPCFSLCCALLCCAPPCVTMVTSP